MRSSKVETVGGSQWRTLATMFVVAVVLNYPWERAQSSLYVGMDGSLIAWWLCFLASLGDGMLVLLIYAVGRVALRRPDWSERPGVGGYALMLAAGLAFSIGVEWATVRVLGWWAYTPRMPLVRGLDVGIPPVAQMLVLPPLIFRIVAAWRGRASAQSARATQEIK